MSGCNITPGEIKKALLEKALPIAKSFDSSFSITRAGEIFLPVSSSVQYKDAPYKLKRIIDKAISGIYRELGIDKKKFRYTFGYQQYNDGAAIQVTVSPSLLKAYQVKNNEKSLEQAFPNAPTQLDMFSQRTDKSEIAIEDFLPPLSPSKKLTQPTFDVEQGIEKRSSSEFVYEGEVYPSYADALAAKKEDSYEEEDYTLSKESPSTEINPGVEELFNENPELANQVYEALGFVGDLNKLTVQDMKTKVFNIANTLETAKNNLLNEIQNSYIVDTHKEVMSKVVEGVFNISGSNPLIQDDLNTYKEYNPKKFEEYINYELGDRFNKRQLTNIISNNNVELLERIFLQHKLALLASEEGDSGLPDNLAELELSKITPQQKQQAIQLYSQYLDTKNRLYRSESSLRADESKAPSWLLEQPEIKAQQEAQGRWFYKSLQEAQEHLKKFDGDKITYVDVNENIENYNAKDNKFAGGYGRDGREYFVSKEIALTKQNLGGKQDIEGFKEFVGSISNVQEAQSIIPINEMEDIIDNLPPFTKDIEDLGFTEEACDL